ncbi:MAG TPA: hypothetical protein VNQ73_14090 [Ilumatobacter sp.]|nr:hypothetical protein [Ilumatobacter sp.]
MQHRGLRFLAVAFVAVAPFTVAACGGDDDDAGGSGGGSLEAQVVARMMEDADADGPTQEQAECAASQMVSSLGADRTRELLGAPEDSDIEDLLSAQEQQLFMAAAMSCLDVRAMIVEQFVASGFSADDANCLADALGDETLADMGAAAASGGQPDPTVIAGAVMECGITP